MKAAQLARATPLMPLSNNCCFGKYEIPIVWFSSRSRMKGLTECLDGTAVLLPAFRFCVMPLGAIVHFLFSPASALSQKFVCQIRGISFIIETFTLKSHSSISLTFCGIKPNIKPFFCVSSLHILFYITVLCLSVFYPVHLTGFVSPCGTQNPRAFSAPG